MEIGSIDAHKAYMKKEANRLNISVNSAYSTYYSRKLLERLTKINHGDIVVKGSFSQFVHLGYLSRPVLDLDLSSEIGHDLPILLLYRSIYEANEKGLEYDILSQPAQTKNGVYKIAAHVKVSDGISPKQMDIPINIDYKENNKAIFEKQYKRVEPIFTGDEPFYVYTPSYEEHLAEKLYIIAHNRRTDLLNTRLKDFYDLFKLHGTIYDYDKLTLYFACMLEIYGENLALLSAQFLNKDFINRHEEEWKRNALKYQFLDQEVSLAQAVYYARAVLNEQMQRINCSRGIQEQAKSLVRMKKEQ